MKLPITIDIRKLSRLAVMAVLMAVPLKGRALAGYTTFPIQDVLINLNEWSLDDYIHKMTAQAATTAASQEAMRLQWRSMDKWKQQYDHYLNDASYILNTAQATSVIYVQALEVLRELVNVGKAIKANPQGVFASSAISNVTLNTAASVLEVFATMKGLAKKNKDGTLAAKQIMMDGQARCEMLWDVSSQLQQLRGRLRRLAVAIRSYGMLDVWWSLTLPYGIYSHRQIATQCFRRWRDNVNDGRPISIL